MSKQKPKKKESGLVPLTDEQMLQEFRKKRERKKLRRKIITITVLLLALVLGVLLSPLFNVTEVYVEGISYLTRDEVIAAAGLSPGKNTFLYSMGLSRRRIEALPYADRVSVRRILPKAIQVDIVECVPVADVLFIDSNILIDGKGKVLEVRAASDEPIPLPRVTGMDATTFEPGKPLAVSEPDKLARVLSVLEEINSYGLLDRLNQIDVTDVNNLTLQISQVDVVVGDNTQLDYKIKYLDGILKTLRDDEKGRIDLTTIPNVVFKAYVAGQEPTPTPTPDSSADAAADSNAAGDSSANAPDESNASPSPSQSAAGGQSEDASSAE